MSQPTPATPGLLRLYRDLWRYAGPARKWVPAAFVLLLSSQLFKLGVPYLSGRAINVLQQHGIDGLRPAGFLLLLIFSATLLSWMLHGPGRVLERNVALAVRRELSGALIARALSLPLAWHAKHHSGETAHRVRQCSGALYDFAQSQFIYLQNAVRLIGPVIALWLISAQVGALAVAGYVVIAVIIVRFDRVMVHLAHTENAAERRYAAAVLDGLGNVFSVYALRMVHGIKDLIERRLLTIYEPLRKSIVLNEWKWCSVDILSVALSCALVALYVYLSAHGAPSMAETAAQTNNAAAPALRIGNLFMVYEYSAQAGGVITAIAAHFQSFARQQADYASGDIILDSELSHLSDNELSPSIVWSTLSFCDLTFRHSEATVPTVDQLNFTLQRGKRYALIGGSGSGKSTLLRILSGLYVVQTLEFAHDEHAIIAPLDSALWLRTTTMLIPQESEIFEGTLGENLLLPDRAKLLDADAIANALTVSRSDAFVRDAETPVVERGANWSGGQRQRVALARGVIAAQECGLLLLDEPTASLDPETERAVYDNLFAEFNDSCIVSSIHRLNLLDRFDDVLLLEQGKLIAAGSVDYLRETSAQFRALLAAQQKSTAS
ncbi:MAG: transporter related [Verrucomicrobiaceae bacterium]|nr:transporter related [Verrucomicrobiaceae bacterium]